MPIVIDLHISKLRCTDLLWWNCANYCEFRGWFCICCGDTVPVNLKLYLLLSTCVRGFKGVPILIGTAPVVLKLRICWCKVSVVVELYPWWLWWTHLHSCDLICVISLWMRPQSYVLIQMILLVLNYIRLLLFQKETILFGWAFTRELICVTLKVSIIIFCELM